MQDRKERVLQTSTNPELLLAKQEVERISGKIRELKDRAGSDIATLFLQGVKTSFERCRVDIDITHSTVWLYLTGQPDNRPYTQITILYNDFAYNFDKPGEMGIFKPKVSYGGGELADIQPDSPILDYVRFIAFLGEELAKNINESVFSVLKKYAEDLFKLNAERSPVIFKRDALVNAEVKAEDDALLKRILEVLYPGALIYFPERKRNHPDAIRIEKHTEKLVYIELHRKYEGDYKHYETVKPRKEELPGLLKDWGFKFPNGESL